jgi:(1->4)-alpha-D-glucan 1-alpha-D-glucosylmutase
VDDTALASYAQRIEQTMLKSARESKAVTSWMSPNPAYESALGGFVRAVLDPRQGHLFLADLRTNVEIIAWYGALNGLTLVLVKALSPGVPDFYQGHELIELSLVDPDNRRPVDFERRRGCLAGAQALLALPDAVARRAVLRDWVAHATDGRAKFWVTWRALQLRRAHDAMLRNADYVPLEVRGNRALHVLAFARCDGQRWIVVIAGRLFVGLDRPVGVAPAGSDWDDTVVVLPVAPGAPLPSGSWFEDALTGQRHPVVDGALPLARVLTEFPVAALLGAATGNDGPDRQSSGDERTDRDLPA